MITFVALWALYGFAVLRLGPRWKFVRYLPMAIGGLIATAPVWSPVAMTLVPHGCKVDEGSAHPCLLLGMDIGGLLYLLGNVAAWGFFFIPVLGAVGGLYIAVHLPFFLAAKRRDKAEPAPQPRPRQVAVVAVIVFSIVALNAKNHPKTEISASEAREHNTNWRLIVGTIPSGCPASVKVADNWPSDSGLKLTPQEALSAALAAGKIKCDATKDRQIFNNASNYYIRSEGSSQEVVINGWSGTVSAQEMSGYVVTDKKFYKQ